MTIDNQHIKKLIALVESSAGLTVNTSGDLQQLYELIEKRLGYTLSLSTLKRLWGKMKSEKYPRITTLDILAQFCGLANYMVFVSDVCGVKDYEVSHRILTKAIIPDKLDPHTILIIEWNPNRQIIVEHSSIGNFTIIKSTGSKLAAGDSFHCDRLIIGEPCYLDNLSHSGGLSTYYVIGLQGGLTNIEQVDFD